MDADALLVEYRQYARAQGEAEEPRIANKAHDKLLIVRKALRDAGQGKRILELLDDPSEHVRLWAGFDALYLSRDDGLRVLRELANGPEGYARIEATMTLKVLERGQLVLYPWEDGES